MNGSSRLSGSRGNDALDLKVIQLGQEEETCRNRWPDGIHDEVFARLLALNAERASGERERSA